MNRREFLRSTAIVCSGVAMSKRPLAAASGIFAQRDHVPIADRFGDPASHFVFEYYPWYRATPYVHWDQDGRHPPIDLASNYVPLLGAYDSRAAAVMEQHAAWIVESGAGAINVSWWGQGSDVDALVPTLMDVMRAHGIKVAFHIEPYDNQHAYSYARDVEYLIREYGDRRRWDAFLLLERADGSSGPVFKSFRTILPSQSTDCHGVTTAVADYVTDSVWRAQTDRIRQTFARDFDQVTLLADSLDMTRTQAAGFDGIAIYSNFVTPDTWETHAKDCTAANLLFSFNTNPGYDGIRLRQVDPQSCYAPLPFEPGGDTYNWSAENGRERARAASELRIADSFRTTLTLQANPSYANSKRGFFLVYINSFNEWHEGHQFEPMKSAANLTAAERAIGYHNPDDGQYRLDALRSLLNYELTSSV